MTNIERYKKDIAIQCVKHNNRVIIYRRLYQEIIPHMTEFLGQKILRKDMGFTAKFKKKTDMLRNQYNNDDFLISLLHSTHDFKPQRLHIYFHSFGLGYDFRGNPNKSHFELNVKIMYQVNDSTTEYDNRSITLGFVSAQKFSEVKEFNINKNRLVTLDDQWNKFVECQKLYNQAIDIKNNMIWDVYNYLKPNIKIDLE